MQDIFEMLKIFSRPAPEKSKTDLEMDVLVDKIISGKSPESKEELQLYANNSKEIESRLLKAYQEEKDSR